MLALKFDNVCPLYNSKFPPKINDTVATLYLYTDDNNRIVLKPIPEAADCQGDYINACYIDVIIIIIIMDSRRRLTSLIHLISLIGIFSS